MKTVFTKEDVNIRHEFPGTNAPKKGVLFKGFDVEIVETVEGDVIEGNNEWYVDKNGDFLWSGGFSDVQPATSVETPVLDTDVQKVGWGWKALELPEIWQTGITGEEIIVAVLDTGLFEGHPDIDAQKIIGRKNLLDNSEDIKDTIGHGTHCAGIIAAQGRMVRGVAPDVQLLIGKVTNVSFKLKEENLLKGIEWAVKNNAEIISMSLYLDAVSNEFRKEFENLLSGQNILPVSSVGNDGDLGFDINRFPASLPGCLSVGSFNKDGKIDSFTTRSKNLNILAPGSEIKSLWNDGKTKLESGTSMATAFVSGVLAVIKSFMKKNTISLDKDELVNIIKSNVERQIKFKPGEQQAYGIIDPGKIMQAIGRM